MTRTRALPPSPALLGLALPLVLVTSIGACDSDEGPDREDPEAILAAVVDYESTMERVDLNGVETIHPVAGGGKTAQIWATPEAAAIFRTLDFDAPPPAEGSVEFPQGTIFVKAIFEPDTGEALDVLQIAAKFEPGYHPAAADWWYAITTRSGEVLMEVEGKGGEVEFCRDCHDSMGGDWDRVIPLSADNLR